jgi:hypothetical protein
VGISDGGSITRSVISSFEYDRSKGYNPRLIKTAENILAVVYRGANKDGFINTLEISRDGRIDNRVIDSLEFDTADGYKPDVIEISPNVYAMAYRGAKSDGFVSTVEIGADGLISDSLIDTFEYDTADGYEPSLVHVSGSIYAVAYRGSSDTGYVKTLNIASSGGPSGDPETINTFMIESTAGGTRTTATVSINKDSVSVTSWQISR